MRTLILTNIDPKMLVSANQRIHHMVRAKVCAYWRAQAAHLVPTRPTPRVGLHRVVITFRFPTQHRRDVGNLYPYVAKPLVDGLVDAGLFVDDDDLHIVGPDLRRDRVAGAHRLTIAITKEGAG